jgi:hypothetical protein
MDGLVASDEEVRKSIIDRKTWKSRISMIVKENTSRNSGGRCSSRNNIAVQYHLNELRDKLSRLVFVVV